MTTEGNAAQPAENQLVTGPFGQFLKDHGINSVPMPASSGVETLELDGKDLGSALRLLRSSAEVKLDLLVTVSGVDNPESFDSVYHLWSYSNRNELVVKVRVPKNTLQGERLPEVPSIAPFWSTANWHERETYDLVGIRYFGHPYLRRILNPWDWEGHPLRRDYKQLVDALNDKSPGSFR
jgi:NADH-quinone oxidoreductase subunit C